MINKEIVGRTLDEFFRLVNEVVTPYFVSIGYRQKILKGRSMVIFEKEIESGTATVDLFCYIKYGVMAFRVTFNSPYDYLHIITQNENSTSDSPWKYADASELKVLLKEAIIKIKKERVLEKGETGKV